MALPEMRRGGVYHRVCKPEWLDCSDTSYAKRFGGRWNPAAAFGALYLNATVQVAAANARRWHIGRAIGLFDLQPERRPQLATFAVPRVRVVDVVTAAGIAGVGLPATYPAGVPWEPCQTIARTAYGQLAGVAARSAADERAHPGEELAVFDTHPLPEPTTRTPFAAWYPDPAPGPRSTVAVARARLTRRAPGVAVGAGAPSRSGR